MALRRAPRLTLPLFALDRNRRSVRIERHHLLIAPDVDWTAVAPMFGDRGGRRFLDRASGLDCDVWKILFFDFHARSIPWSGNSRGRRFPLSRGKGVRWERGPG